MKLEDVLAEARKGKFIKQRTDIDWYDIRTVLSTSDVDELLSDDWELEPKTVTVTKEQFARVFDNAVGLGIPMLHMYNYICKELGLGDDK